MEIFIVVIFWAAVFWVCWKWFLRVWIGRQSASKSVLAAVAARQIPEEAYFEMVGDELRRGIVRNGLWLKAMADSGGDEKRATAAYTRLRVASMRQEAAARIRAASDSESGV
jgi:hypothetical protein